MSIETNKDESKTTVVTTTQVKTDAELMRENEMLRAQIKLREDQLKQAIGIANTATDQSKAREEGERQDLIMRIAMDTAGKYTQDELKDKTLSELRLIKTVVDKSLDHTFASIAAYQAEVDRKKTPLFTVGMWDSKKKDWIGGT